MIKKSGMWNRNISSCKKGVMCAHTTNVIAITLHQSIQCILSLLIKPKTVSQIPAQHPFHNSKNKRNPQKALCLPPHRMDNL